MNSVYITVINDLVSDARAHRTCLTLMKSGARVFLLGRKLKNSLNTGEREYHTKRFKLCINKGVLFYLFYNLRLFIYLVSRPKNSLLVACDLDTLPANYLASSIRKFPLIYDSHEYFTELPELQHRPIPRKIWLMIEGFILPRIKYAYTVSDPIAREYYEKYKVNFEVIRNLPLTKKPGVPFPIPEKFRLKRKIIYQGAVNMGRGIEQMMEAVKLMDNVVFIVAGDGDLYSELLEKAINEDLNDRVFFTGRLPLEKLNDLTVQCDIGVSLEQDMGKNYRYALPNKLFDYFLAGIPVLVSNLPAMKEVVEKYGTGMLAESDDPSSLKEKIECILYNEEARKKWKENLALAAEELCWEKEEKKLKAVFRRVGLTFQE